jgi:DHA2 family methylenomycin A resistance protein-like MFS transporter
MNAAVQTIDALPVAAKLPVTIACTSLGFFVVQLDGSILNVALPQIGVFLGIGVDGLQWTVDAYFVAFAVLLLSAGVVSDRLGARRAFVSGFAVFSVASLACALSSSPTALILARALQGGGAALLVPCSLALLNNACGDDTAARARAIGLWTAAGGVALAAGPVVGGLLVGSLGWSSIFLINVPIGLIGIWLTLRFIDEIEPVNAPNGLDLAGQTLAVLALLGLVGAIIEAGRLGWQAPLVASGLLLAIVAGGGFLAVELRTAAPMVPLVLFRNPTFRGATLVGFVVNLVVFGLSFAFPLYFQRVLLYSPAGTGLACLPFALTVTAANIVGGRVAARTGPRLPVIGGLLVTAAGFALLCGIGETTTYLAMLPGQLLIRVGIGFVIPPMTAALLSTVDRARSGTASGVLNAARQTGGTIGVALFGALMARDLVAGIQIALAISVGLLALAAMAAAICLQSRKTELLPTSKQDGRN